MRFILVEERQVDIDAFDRKFGDGSFDKFNKLKGRLKNNNVSVDIVYHTKNTSVEDMKQLLSDTEQRVVKDKETGETKLNRILVAENEYYAVYDVLDWETAMNMGEGTGWCITGRYNTDGEVKPSQAKQYFNEYLEKGVESYLFFMPKKENVEKYCLCITSDPSKFQFWDSKDIGRDIGSIPVNDTFPEFEFKGVSVGKRSGIFRINGVLVSVDKSISGNITIPNSVKSIGTYAFANCIGLTSVTIPDSVTEIGSEAFRGCTGLTSVDIGNGVTTIGEYAFCGCTALTTVTMGNNVTTIGDNAFYCCINLVSITLGDGLKTIGVGAFDNCTELSSINIPSGVEKIPDGAFYDCSNLKEINIPNSVTSLGKSALKGCYQLERINYNGTIREWDTVHKGIDWDYNSDKYVVHCSDGDIES